MITLTNDFHKTSVRVHAEIGDILTRTQMRRITKKLCGSKGCKCGVVRGVQDQPNGDVINIGDVWDDIEESWTYLIKPSWNDPDFIPDL